MPKEKEKLLITANNFVKRGKPSEALGYFRKALEIDQKDAKVWLRIGDLCKRINKINEAIEAYCKAAELYTRDGFYSKAIAVYKEMLLLEENMANIYLHTLALADLYSRLGMIGDAMSQYTKVEIGYEKDGRLNEALDIYKKMAELEPLNIELLIKLAKLAETTNALEAAKKAYLQLFNILVSDPVNAKQLDLPPLKTLLQEISSLSLEKVKSTYSFIKYLAEKKESFEDIIASFREGVAKIFTEKDASVHYDLSLAYKEMDLFNDAIHELHLALNAGYRPADCYTMMGLCYYDAKNYKEAIKSFNAGLKLPDLTNDQKGNLNYELGIVLKESGDYKKSLEAFQTCCIILPGHRDVYNKIIEVQSLLAQPPKPPVVEEIPEIPIELPPISEEEQEKKSQIERIKSLEEENKILRQKYEQMRKKLEKKKLKSSKSKK
ncbi:tetratricopeptide repeat protein [Candidatus Falkowbacteria bacterium]|nr:tetratricopeptide repeat protein [Candidatus Falkowbacteria bacterium]